MNVQNKDFSLLTQEEIDTLIGFISDKRGEMDSSVLSQDSIDKLLELLKFSDGRGKKEEILNIGEVQGALADLVAVRKADEVCTLEFSVDDTTDFIHLEIANTETKERMDITPEMFNPGDGDVWGHCIAPLVLHRMARALNVKYTTDTYEALCKRYAKYIYGDENRKLPFLFMPGNRENIGNIL